MNYKLCFQFMFRNGLNLIQTGFEFRIDTTKLLDDTVLMKCLPVVGVALAVAMSWVVDSCDFCGHHCTFRSSVAVHENKCQIKLRIKML